MSQATTPAQAPLSAGVWEGGRELGRAIGRGLRKAFPWMLALYLGRILWLSFLFPTLLSLFEGLGLLLWKAIPPDQPGVYAVQRIVGEWWFPSALEVAIFRTLSNYSLLIGVLLLGGAVEVVRRRLQRTTGWSHRRWSWATLGLAGLVLASSLLAAGLCTRPFSQGFLHDMAMEGNPKETWGWVVLGFPAAAFICRWLIHRKSPLAPAPGFRAKVGRALRLVAFSSLLALLFLGFMPTYPVFFSHWVNPPGVLVVDEFQSPGYFRVAHHLLVVLSGLSFLFVRHLFRHLVYGAPLWPDRTLKAAGLGMVVAGAVYWGDGYLFCDFGRTGLLRRVGLAEPAMHPQQVRVEWRTGLPEASLRDACMVLGGARWVRKPGWFVGLYEDEHLAPTTKNLAALEEALDAPGMRGSIYRADPLVPLLNAYRYQGRLSDYTRLTYQYLYQSDAPAWSGMSRGARRFFALTPVDEDYRHAAAYAIAHVDPLNRNKVLLATIAALRTGDEEAANRLLALVILNGWSLDTSDASTGKSALSGAGGIDKLTRNFSGLLRGTGTGDGANAEKDSSALVQDWFTSSATAFRQEGELKGIVLLDGKPPRDGWVDLVAEANADGVKLSTRLFGRKLDAAGGFHLEGLVPGTYSLSLRFLDPDGSLGTQVKRSLYPDGKTLKVQVEGALGDIQLGSGHQRLDLGTINVWLDDATGLKLPTGKKK